MEQGTERVIAEVIIKGLIALLPVCMFLLVLLHLDTHRLLGAHLLSKVFTAGCALAILSYFANGVMLDLLPLSFLDYTRYGAPLVEELLKAAAIIYLIRANRVGFLVDAAILGYTVGAGFSFLENLYYLYSMSEAHYGTWIVRGFGTALMHGGATAMFAVISQIVTERHRHQHWYWYVPGLLAAVLLHSIFNHFPVSPILSTLVTLLILPTVAFMLFERNTVAIHNFLELDFEEHRKLLKQIEEGEYTGCEKGRFLVDLEKVYSTPLVNDMILYIRLHTELVLSAEGILLARERGVEIGIEKTTKEKIKHMHLLERTIGKTGLNTMKPHLHFSSREFWVLHLLEDEMHEHIA